MIISVNWLLKTKKHHMNFITGKELNDKIYDLIYNSEKYLLILSPFIQLGDYIKKEIFKTHLNNSNVHIIIGFGKNENNINRSLKKEDFEYFTQFKNISIVYIPNLHAKYYGNENESVVTSMNLIDYSFDHNIEFGAHSKKKIISIFQNSFFNSAVSACFNTLEVDGYAIYVRRPIFEKKLIFGKNYVGSDEELDMIDQLVKFGKVPKKSLSDFENAKYVNSTIKNQRKSQDEYKVGRESNGNAKKNGYCIRCKTSVNLDLNKPLCLDCYKTWSLYQDPFYRENFCISCGEKNNTNFNRPACTQCYKELQSK